MENGVPEMHCRALRTDGMFRDGEIRAFMMERL